MISLGRIFFISLAALTALLCRAPAALAVTAAYDGAAGDAADITGRCLITVPPDDNGYSPGTGALYDNDPGTYMRLQDNGPPCWEVDLRGADAQGIYIQWEYAPDSWSFEALSGSGELLVSQERGGSGYIQEYVPLPEGCRSLRVVRPEKSERPLSMLELSVWSRGALPDSVHDWDPTPGECELMVISAHQDDELLFFGGVIPYYTGEKQLDTVVVYMANCGSKRLHEALDGLWACGARQYPVFVMLPDVKSLSIDAARRTWDEDEVTDIIARLFIQYRPQVVVTHDINGEYGHGQHMLTAFCVQRALILCEDSAEAQRLLPGSVPYMVPKCYLHLWEQNEVYMDWDALYLKRLGMTAADAASAGYERHVSQHRWYEGVFFGGAYDCSRFGLYHTHAGTDRAGNDLFENITPRISSPASVPEPPDGFVTASHSGFIYAGKDSDPDGKTIYIRYGAVNGTADWYLCDRTGKLSQVGGQPVRYRSNIFNVISDVIAPGGTDTQEVPGGSLLDNRLFGVLGALAGGDPAVMLAVFSAFFIAVLAVLVIILSAVIRGGRRRKRRG